MILDIHTHNLRPNSEAIIDASTLIAGQLMPLQQIIAGNADYAGQCWSVGVHPWDTINDIHDALWEAVETSARSENVVAIGEAGIDTLKGGPMFRQLQVFSRLVALSEQTAKPLIIHDVKAHDIIIGLKRDLHPAMPWIIHGFRGKPTVAKMLLDAGCYLSFGEKFNPDTVRYTPAARLLTETDESPLPINKIIASLAAARGLTPDSQEALIVANTSRLFTLPARSGWPV